ncbi:MAG: radical SAM protein [Planctomycetes bacterium]|nr:radical SAM protein [Planctomycetota bacterium]
MANPFEGSPEYVIWEVTRACNLRCRHCAAGAGRPAPDELSTREALGVVEELRAIGAPSVCLMGGEVFLREDWIEIAEALRAAGLAAGIITNGLLLDDAAIRRLEALGICQIGVSIDAARPKVHDGIRGARGAHEAAVRAIRAIRSLGFLSFRTIITSIHKRNIGELEGIRDLLLEESEGLEGAPFDWRLNIASPHAETRMRRDEAIGDADFLRLVRFIAENRPAIRDRIRLSGSHDLGYFSRRFPDLHDFCWEGCPAGLGTLGVTAEGNVKGCLILSDRFIDGNVRERPLRAIWRDPEAFAYNRRFRVEDLRGQCSGCPHGPVCRAGCRDHAEAFTGSPFEAPFCLFRMEERGEI